MKVKKRSLPSIILLTVPLALALGAPHNSVAEEKGGAEHGSSHAAPTQKKEGGKKKKKSGGELEQVAIEEPAPPEFPDSALAGQPIDAVLLLDASGSMKNTDPSRLRDKAAKLFLRFLKERDRVAIFEFENGVRPTLPFTEVTPTQLFEFDEKIESVSVEGRFTDLQAPIKAAMQLLEEQGRKDALRTVILLTDGRMDPHPSRGSSEQLLTELFQRDIKGCREEKIAIYTVGLGGGVDGKLLKEIAQECGGSYWYAPDANTVHQRFSDLFLDLRKPQIAPLEKNGFEIDPSVQEATFYITREQTEAEVSLVDPRNQEIANTTFPPNIQWSRGDRFDIITIKKPQPGLWRVRGIESAEGFATLLTDLQLQVPGLGSWVRVNQPVTLSARLMDRGQLIKQSEFRERTFFNFKVIETRTGEVVFNGALRDDGSEGDLSKEDFIYSAQLKFERPGVYKILVGVVAPTFTREQHLSVEVPESSVALQYLPKDRFLRKPERIQVTLSPAAAGWSDLRLQVVARRENQPRGYLLRSTPVKEGKSDLFEVDPTVLPLENGASTEYNVRAKVEGTDGFGRRVEEFSDVLPYLASVIGGSDAELELEPEPKETVIAKILLAVASTFLWCWFLCKYFLLRRRDGVRNSVGLVQGIELEPEFFKGLSLLRGMSASERREVRAQDRELFDLVSDVYNDPTRHEEILNQHLGALEKPTEGPDGHTEAQHTNRVESESSGGEQGAEAPSGEGSGGEASESAPSGEAPSGETPSEEGEKQS